MNSRMQNGKPGEPGARTENAMPAGAIASEHPREARTDPKAVEQAGARAARRRVVIIGAGFGGLNAAKALARTDLDVLVLDRHNYHGFWPLLYQVATAGLEGDSIAYPVRAITRRYPNVRFRMAKVEGMDFDKRLVMIDDDAPIPYDYLILAAGSTSNYFGSDAIAEHTYGLKDVADAQRLRAALLTAFEQAASDPHPECVRQFLTFVIVGGGPTGVELCGAVSELIHQVLRKDYPRLDVSVARIILIDANEQVLTTFPESLRESAQRKLQSMGVEVRLNTRVSSVTESAVILMDGTRIEASTVVWAAGVRAAHLSDALNAEHEHSGRVKVTPNLNLPGHPEVFAIGDIAGLQAPKGDHSYPMLAQVAIQQGKRAARNILAQAHGRSIQPFHYFDMGTMATIGRSNAVFDAFGIHLSGRIAWWGWLIVHLINLIGFRNRMIVLLDWAFSYFTYDRGVRAITSDQREGQRTENREEKIVEEHATA